jgi:hypothetical protein
VWLQRGGRSTAEQQLSAAEGTVAAALGFGRLRSRVQEGLGGSCRVAAAPLTRGPEERSSPEISESVGRRGNRGRGGRKGRTGADVRGPRSERERKGKESQRAARAEGEKEMGLLGWAASFHPFSFSSFVFLTH